MEQAMDERSWSRVQARRMDEEERRWHEAQFMRCDDCNELVRKLSCGDPRRARGQRYENCRCLQKLDEEV